LIPSTKVKPDTGSPFHGVPITEDFPLPAGFVNARNVRTWKLIKGQDRAVEAEALPRRALLPLSGQARIEEGRRFYQLLRDGTRWVQASDVAVFDVDQQHGVAPAEGPHGHRSPRQFQLERLLCVGSGHCLLIPRIGCRMSAGRRNAVIPPRFSLTARRAAAMFGATRELFHKPAPTLCSRHISASRSCSRSAS
jgi:hypothetical protein